MLQKAVHNMSLWDAHSEEFVRQAQLYNKFDPFCDCIICAEDATSGELATLLILVGDAARLPSPPPTLALTSSHSPVLPPHPLPPAGCAGLGEDALAAAAPERAAAAEAASGSANRRGPAGTLCLQGWFECASLLGVFSLMPPPPSFLLAVCLDGNSKFMRFAVGEAQSEERPKVLTFMAKTGLVVMEDHQSGLLSSAAQQAWLLSEGGKPCGGSCASTLTANRPTAAQQGLLALYGVAGLFCPHGMLGRDCIVPMPTPEQHAFHLRNLLSFISRRPDLRDIYLDIACRIKKSMQAQLQAEVAAGNLPADVLEVGGVNEVLGVGWLGGPACEVLYPTQKRWSFICRL